jgi:hypothetical protein
LLTHFVSNAVEGPAVALAFALAVAFAFAVAFGIKRGAQPTKKSHAEGVTALPKAGVQPEGRND